MFQINKSNLKLDMKMQQLSVVLTGVLDVEVSGLGPGAVPSQ